MVVKIDIDFQRGDVVFLIADEEQLKRIVVGFCVFENNSVLYRLAYGTETSAHYAIEISREKSVI